MDTGGCSGTKTLRPRPAHRGTFRNPDFAGLSSYSTKDPPPRAGGHLSYQKYLFCESLRLNCDLVISFAGKTLNLDNDN
jgi:hypothetical protein